MPTMPAMRQRRCAGDCSTARSSARLSPGWSAARNSAVTAFPRGLPAAAAAGPRAGDLTDLLRACLAALRLPDEADRLYRPRPPPLWQVPDAMARIRSLLVTLPDGAALLACLPAIAPDAAERDLRCRAAVASTLVAGLEMARGEALVLEQEGAFTVIRCRKAKGATPGPRQSRSLGT